MLQLGTFVKAKVTDSPSQGLLVPMGVLEGGADRHRLFFTRCSAGSAASRRLRRSCGQLRLLLKLDQGWRLIL